MDTAVLCRALSRPSCLTCYRSRTRPFPSISFSWLMALAAIDPQQRSLLLGHLLTAPCGRSETLRTSPSPCRPCALPALPHPTSLPGSLPPPCLVPSLQGPPGGRQNIHHPPPSRQAQENISPPLAPTNSSSWVEELSGEKLQGREGQWGSTPPHPKLPINLGHQAPASGFNSYRTWEESLCLQGRPLPRDASSRSPGGRWGRPLRWCQWAEGPGARSGLWRLLAGAAVPRLQSPCPSLLPCLGKP